MMDEEVTITERVLRNAWIRMDRVGDPRTAHSLWKHILYELTPDEICLHDGVEDASDCPRAPRELADSLCNAEFMAGARCELREGHSGSHRNSE